MTGSLPPDELEGLKERGWRQVAAIDAALERGEIGEDDWHRAMAELIVPAYLAGDNPRAQSGHSGDAARWEGARRLLLDAVAADGSFLDVGCANGHLLECLRRWAAEDGVALDPWGVEISGDLAGLARERLPAWREQIFVGNALDWRPPRRFDFVRTNVDYVPVPAATRVPPPLARGCRRAGWAAHRRRVQRGDGPRCAGKRQRRRGDSR